MSSIRRWQLSVIAFNITAKIHQWFPPHRASNVERISMSWHRHDIIMRQYCSQLYSFSLSCVHQIGSLYHILKLVPFDLYYILRKNVFTVQLSIPLCSTNYLSETASFLHFKHIDNSLPLIYLISPPICLRTSVVIWSSLSIHIPNMFYETPHLYFTVIKLLQVIFINICSYWWFTNWTNKSINANAIINFLLDSMPR